LSSSGVTGLFGGAFDPPHYGHVALAERALAHFGLERLVVLPTGDPPHKTATAPAEIRCRLAGAAFAGHPEICLSRHELDRPGPSYTVDTAEWAAGKYGDAIFLVGADEFGDFLTWKKPQRILELVRLGVATRPGFERSDLEPVLAELDRPERVEFFEIEPLPASSSDIRARVRRGEPIEGLVPPAVEALIRSLGLYRNE
jgi:nicotinate-nucleotide adenylyltransferase